jgi:hypothetical protein
MLKTGPHKSIRPTATRADADFIKTVTARSDHETPIPSEAERPELRPKNAREG